MSFGVFGLYLRLRSLPPFREDTTVSVPDLSSSRSVVARLNSYDNQAVPYTLSEKRWRQRHWRHRFIKLGADTVVFTWEHLEAGVKVGHAHQRASRFLRNGSRLLQFYATVTLALQTQSSAHNVSVYGLTLPLEKTNFGWIGLRLVVFSLKMENKTISHRTNFCFAHG